MDEKQTENPISIDYLDNTNVPVITADLEMLSIDTNLPPIENKILRKRISRQENKILRKGISRSVCTEVLNRRYSLRSKKRRISEVETQEETIKEYYLDKKINKKSNNLETIYKENGSESDDAVIRMSAKRLREC